MKNLSFVIFLLFFTTTVVCAQQMQTGFTYLETGDYKNAETFFENILKEYPENKTAKLCYGRAVGLNGKPEQAVTIFTELLNTYPSDFEIQLNYAESLLWSKKYNQAKDYYITLTNTNPKSFAALLGYANTLSNLKEYNKALEYVNKALVVLPNNPNAMVSKKYIYLGLANQQQQNQQYEEAIATLKTDMELFPKDRDIYLNLANTYIIAKKHQEAEDLFIEMQQDSTLYFHAKNGLALNAHLQEKEKKALEISTQTLSEINDHTAEKDIKNTQERYAQALIWNKKYKTAKKYIDEIAKGKENENWILGLKATLYTYTGDFNKSLKTYNAILNNDETSFDGNLGKANALKANGQINNAYLAARETLVHFPNQKDALNFINNLNSSYIPIFESDARYSFDNGDSKAYTSTSHVVFPMSTKLTLSTQYQYKKAINDVTDNNSTSNLIGAGLGYLVHPKINFIGTVGINKINGNKSSYDQFYTDILFKTKPYKLQNLDIGYKRELQNFNAELLNREIIQNNFYGNYNLSTNFNLGWFTQYYYTTQNDDNTRNLLFTSLYYNLIPKPALKTGINFQYLTFKNQVPTIYFSPAEFKAVEIFVNLIKDRGIAKSNNWYYGLTAAIGYQYIEKDPKQSTYRIQSNIGYKFTDQCYLEGFANHSNIASAAASGFTFTEFGVKFIWHFLKKPVFKTL
ncbi:tetratricopeptide repeat protein [Wenyingzhuangia sp. chi5]|uniref:Tetratricopeptide repeat protein n=1 Tax=Wenyingzhuangia gilva TaxID=3057677 RepID=A0ABT8VTW0_9FLAO|nr:tetratricopeptide repeat protein [Wenyingzhuangia sp. chi5]MDO3695409.1 tetratricopeptide repeat protein [Wenyingzhuangia sp. chi5]